MPTVLPALDAHDAATRVVSLRTQYPEELLGVPSEGLRLTWALAHGSAAQIGYQLRWGEAAIEEEPVRSAASIGMPAPGGVLGSDETRRYAVRVATADGWSAWSEPLVVEGALAAADFVAQGIGAELPLGGPAALLRTTFRLESEPIRARLRSTSLGLHELRLNGAKAGDEHLAPGWTAYQERVVVATLDVTGLLRRGENVLSGLLADGWYRGRLGWVDGVEHYGTQLALVAQLDVELADGSTVRVVTGPGWRTATGAVRTNSLYDGADLDLAAEPVGWDAPGFDDSGWAEATIVDLDRSLLEPRVTTGVRTVAELPMAVRDSTADGGALVLDAGQNIAGWVRLVVRGGAGDRVTVRHAEVLEPDGSLHTRSLRSARATETYVLAADGETTLEPAFTFHGFQFADVSGAEVVSATAVAISSAVRPRSSFASSVPALDRLHSNVVWSQLDNFVSVPTDCPQRDERLGWTGDAQAFAATASTLFDVESFWSSWLRDLEIDQSDAEGVPAVVPNILGEAFSAEGESQGSMGRAGWADAATIVPWAVYESYGDPAVILRQADSMRRWVDHLERRSGEDGFLPVEFQFGDWLDPDAPSDEPWRAKVSAEFVAHAFWAHSARLTARAEELAGDEGSARRYHAMADAVAERAWARWGEHAVQSQTGCALALQFRIAPESDRDRIGRELATLVRTEDGRIATGFLGTPLVLHALAETGHIDEAYLMLLRRESPSWLYQVEMGATTVWERWDSLRPDGSIHSGDMASDGSVMLSFNHYAYGAVVDWLYRYVAGIAPTPDDPGYRTVLVRPRPAEGVTAAAAHVNARHGRVAIDWELDPETRDLRIDLDVPPGARAVLDLPITAESVVAVDGESGAWAELGPGHHRIDVRTARVAAALGSVRAG
ncbi:family 78 glycoside hydrolase catalytic domain [Agromyces sp. G08B096]|uniref:alpha-L-rhamnosidase n=1 Tax=Agromyces sp. G08B096 TaxID=3156399 RepID=A0AAU7W7V0_9MICO